MSSSNPQKVSAVARPQQYNAQMSAHLPQQHPTRLHVNSRPKDSPKPRQKSAVLSVIASLPPSSRSSSSSSSLLSSCSSISSPSPTASTSEPNASGSSPNMSTPNASTSTKSSVAHGITSSSSSSKSAFHTGHRAASGTLDRIAALPISAAARVQESDLSPRQNVQRGSDGRASTSGTSVIRHVNGQIARSSSSSKPYPRTGRTPTGQVTPIQSVIVPTQLAQPALSKGPFVSRPSAQLSPGNQISAINQVQNAGVSRQTPPQSTQPPLTPAENSPAHVHTLPPHRVHTNSAAESPNSILTNVGSDSLNGSHPKILQPAQQSATRGNYHTQPLSRPLSHVLITSTPPQAATPSRALTGSRSWRVEASSAQKPEASRCQVASHAPVATASSAATPSSLAQNAIPNSSPRSPATLLHSGTALSSSPKTQSVPTQAGTDPLVPARPATPTHPEGLARLRPQAQPQSSAASAPNGILSKPDAGSNGSLLPTQSASAVVNNRVASASASNVNPNIWNDPRGSFLTSTEPVNYESLLANKRKVTPVSVVSCLTLTEEELDNLIVDHVEEQCLPLVISDLHKTAAWSSDLFNLEKYQHLASDRGLEGEAVGARNLTDGKKRVIPVTEFLAHCNNVKEYSPNQTEKLYGEELPCPAAWKQALDAMVHPRLQYHGEHDLSSSLSSNARSVSLACRFGPGRTCLPLHRSLCSSLTQDLMVWSDPEASSIWMIANPEDADAVDQYISSKGGDPQAETFSPRPKELISAPFPVFCCEQKLGDLVLVPSRATHMVVNTGGRTMTVAWSRTTADTLSSALFAELPLYQRYCRREKHHVKSVIEETLIKYTKQIESHADTALELLPETFRDLCKLLEMYDAIITDEYVPEWRDIVREGSVDSYVECDFCGVDILHGYFECSAGETLCTLCYCQGRLCGCSDAAETLKPRQHWRTFGDRLQIRNRAAQVLLKVKPDLALEKEPATDDDEERDSESSESAPWAVKLLKEETMREEEWPFAFLAAFRLYNIRQTAGWQSKMGTCRLCKAALDVTQRRYCKPCRHSYCHGCLLHRLKIHPVHTFAQDNAEHFHNYHRKNSVLDYKEWLQDPLLYRVQARAHFALMEAARIYMRCTPINEKCRIGFLDVTPEHPHGLSGKLDLKKPRKDAKDKAKDAAASASAPASASTISTPISRKRQSDVLQAPSAPSPRDVMGKRARLDTPPDVEAMDEEEIALLTPNDHAVSSVRIDPAPTRSTISTLRAATDRTIASSTSQNKGVASSVPTVESGIRKFVLRAGGAVPISPTTPTSSVSSSSSATKATTSAPASLNVQGNSQVIAETPPKLPSTAAQSQLTATSIVHLSKGSASSPPSAPIVAKELVATSAPTAAAATAPGPKTAMTSLADPAQADAATVPASAQRAVVQPATVPQALESRSEGTVPALVAQVIERGKAGVESSRAATSVAASSTGTGTSSHRPAMTTADAVGSVLSTLDATNLRVITEVLRIFCNSMKELHAEAAEENRKSRAEQAVVQTKQAEELRQMREMLVAQSKELREMKEKQREAEAKHVDAMSQVSRKLDVTEEKVDQVHGMFQGLMDDIERGARAQLEENESMQAGEPIVIDAASSRFSSLTPNSNAQ
ncbi:hypothetical protein NDA13_004305 [Ustilago tritici]|nr:hypothetical protein NDA13_004305 [Ustilago tritici]